MAKAQFGSSMVRTIFERDKGICVYCGAPAQEIDHVIPIKDGGLPIRSNAVCVCKRCNCNKRDHPNDIDYLTRAIFWLLQQGEDTSWMDTFYG